MSHPSLNELVARRRAALGGANLRLFYDPAPLQVVRGEGSIGFITVVFLSEECLIPHSFFYFVFVSVLFFKIIE
jgi:hypothetical protein